MFEGNGGAMGKTQRHKRLQQSAVRAIRPATAESMCEDVIFRGVLIHVIGLLTEVLDELGARRRDYSWVPWLLVYFSLIASFALYCKVRVLSAGGL
jgi:hypothetical protein